MVRSSSPTTTRARSTGSPTNHNSEGGFAPLPMPFPRIRLREQKRALGADHHECPRWGEGLVSDYRVYFLLVAAVVIVSIGTGAWAADLEAGRRKAEACATCHGPDGNSTVPGTPSLAGQPVYFTHWQLIK